MEREEIVNLIERQQRYFRTGATLDVSSRIEILRKLRDLIIQYENELAIALHTDFCKPEFEVIATETRFVIKEITYIIRHLRSWIRKRRVSTPLVHFISRSYINPEPYGQVLVLSPWNFPFQLAFMPLVGAIAAGNTVILKASSQVPATCAVMTKILSSFSDEQIAIIDGDHSMSDFLLDQKFDYIFFTGSPSVGKHVMRKASENLIPVSLELGGKNPCLVTEDAHLEFAARRIAWGKFLNAGQACVAPDYLLIDNKVKGRFIELLKSEITKFYGKDPQKSENFARIVSVRSTERLASFLSDGIIVTGGKVDVQNRYISPTVLIDVNTSDAVMSDEIFGPILPVISYNNIEEIYPVIEKYPKPLATYIFSGSKKVISEFMKRTQSGNAAVNETVMQIASSTLPYGGIGPSGLGRYHGKKSFETFSNMRSVLWKSNIMDIWLRYPPYSKLKTKIISWLMSL